ncbi:AAA family ATPase [uncultured Microbulbifer sp.]|uniref:AAA family ATPase n=1 Tax=uncultured Microbulbifer sp. TaxID=348147 RepID=UPI00262133D8|nr:AAA family ATPase [uncultured Microbulbifer sp.]
MDKILIFGNSGSGKSTLAKHLSRKSGLYHLDLDSLAWLPTTPPQRMPIEESRVQMKTFLKEQVSWVVEGCYTDLLELLIAQATEIIFMDLNVKQCLDNAKNRPWEPHKYESKEAQDANLNMLVNWIRDYYSRANTFSHQAHLRFYNSFKGKKSAYTENPTYL